jgi:hypothetical protein
VVLHWSEGDGLASFPHTLVVAEDGSEVTVFDRYGSTDTGVDTTGHLVDAVVELVVGENAHVRYLSVQEHGPRTWQVALQRAHLGRDSTLKSSVVALGDAYARLRSESLLAGSGAESDLTAVYFGDGDQMLDFRTLQDHGAPNTRGSPVQRRGRGHRAVGVLGLIRIRRNGQKSVAFRPTATSCSRAAEAKSVPNLEIEANDASARTEHRRPVDADQLYLATRGVPRRKRSGWTCWGSSTTFDRLRCRRWSRRCGAGDREDRAPRPDRGPWLSSACAVSDRRAPPPVRSRRPPALRGQPRGRVLRDRRPAPTPTTRCAGATCGRGRDRGKHARLHVLVGHRRAPELPATRPVRVYDVRVEGDDVIVSTT